MPTMRPNLRPSCLTWPTCLLVGAFTVGCAGWPATTEAANQNTPASNTAKKQARPKTQPHTQARVERYADHAAAQAWARELAQRNGWDETWVRQWLGTAQKLPSVIKLVAPAPTGTVKNWATYRARFIEPKRIDAGVRFWQSHADTLQRAEAQFGVPAWLVAGVIGVETLYGQHTGQFRVLDALATLGFDFPSSHPRAAERSAFFRGELEALLRLSRQNGVAPDEWRGSYAGAMGLPQFMPSSWQKFAVDFDGDGRIDLRRSPADAIGSVANYMKQYGWNTGMPTHYPVGLDAPTVKLDTLLAPDILPTFGVDSFQAQGAQLTGDALQHQGYLALVELLNGDPANGGSPPSYVAGTENFYVITRYNWSSYYAMAVIELGQAVQAALPTLSPPTAAKNPG
jgi:membrane-bound lytic murein transglycosylase B